MCLLDVGQLLAAVCNHMQPSATFHNRSELSVSVSSRPREDGMAVPMATSATAVVFRGAGVALWGIFTFFEKMPKVVEH